MNGKIQLPARYDALTTHERVVVRQRYSAAQKNLCHHCKAPLSGPPTQEMSGYPLDLSTFPPDFFRHPVHLHHDHTTGMTVGAVHAVCNAVLKRLHNQ